MNDLIGIPFVPLGRLKTGCDCAGLVILFYKEVMKINHQDYISYTDVMADNEEKIIASLNHAKFSKTELPKKQGDLLVIRTYGRAAHLGICFDERYFLHTLEGVGSHLASYDNHLWVKRMESRWRMIS